MEMTPKKWWIGYSWKPGQKMGNSPWPINGARSHFGIFLGSRHGWNIAEKSSLGILLPNIGRALPFQNGADHDIWGQGRTYFWASIPWLSGWWLPPLWKKYESVGSIYEIPNIWEVIKFHGSKTTNQLLMINSCWYHHWGCWWLPEIGEKSTASESASIPTSGICECSSTSTSLWNHIETTSKPHWNYHSTCIVSEGFFGHVDVVLWLHLQHLHPARFFV